MSKKLLVVDDDPALRELLNMDLPKEGYEVQTAENGETALKLAGETRFDAVLLDVMMPGTDGYHVALELTKNQGIEASKIIIMTARDTVREKGIAMMSGATATLQKPFTVEQLHEKLREIIGGPS
jgi:DNA-binding response OmpR family regulator